VCANAYVKPLMASYLKRLVARLRDMGVTCPVAMIHSGGGLISVDHAVEFPVRLIESGPAGGAIFAAHIAAQYDLDAVLSYDMGGTTAKICLIEDNNPKTTKTFEVARTYRFKKGSGMPISIPVIEMVEIGAGGGSVAGIDMMRQIRVGPESAGSEPGPACYQKGGSQPTVTDADLLLGRFDPDSFAGGTIPLSVENGRQAIDRFVAGDLGLSVTDAAFGICEVVDENMSNAARVHAVENGKEISDFTMIAFGGAAPLHAGRLCQKLGINRFLVPPGAGVGSAIGFLRAPFGYESVRSAKVLLSGFDADRVNRLLDELTDSTTAFIDDAFHDGTLIFERTAYMRYIGQGWEIPVAIPDIRFAPDDVGTFKTLFEAAYERYFGRPIEGLDIEIVSWSVKVSAPRPPADPVRVMRDGKPAGLTGSREIFDARLQKFVSAGTIERTDLQPGMLVSGPAVITEPETSTIVTSDFEAILQSDGCLLVQSKSG
ncbi:MAG: hydantoinase/oxoprolinase family protein, partial [Fimbriimonadaceae bacterium]|nr:hydantoinase/oxoprolinase family protein [Alphaproteobacteria bacterium]